MSKIRIYGDTSGYVDLSAPAVADNRIINISEEFDSISASVDNKLDIPGAWLSYTPTISGNWTQGNGVTYGRYTIIGSTVFFRAELTLGTTSTTGYGAYISLPVSGTGNGMANCDWVNTGSNYGTAQAKMSSGLVAIYGITTNGAEMSFASVQSWNSGDSFNVSGFYEAA